MPRLFGRGTNVPTRSCFLLIIVPMFAAAIILKIVFSFVPPPRPDMVLEADGMVESATVAEAQAHTTMPIVLPDDMLGSEVYSVGVYTKGAGVLPVGSVAVTLTKNDQRFVELIERPLTALADVVNDYKAISSDDVALGATTGVLLAIPTNNVRCVSANEKWDLPGFCEIPRILLFEDDGIVFSIASDDSHATDGELILLAKSILGPAEDERLSLGGGGLALSEIFPPNFDMSFEDLAYLRGIETTDGKTTVTVDPVVWINCLRGGEEALAPECEDDPSAIFQIQNNDQTTRTVELGPDAGPYVISTITDDAYWRVATEAELVEGMEAVPYVYLFHVIEEDGIATFLIQKYLP